MVGIPFLRDRGVKCPQFLGRRGSQARPQRDRDHKEKTNTNRQPILMFYYLQQTTPPSMFSKAILLSHATHLRLSAMFSENGEERGHW